MVRTPASARPSPTTLPAVPGPTGSQPRPPTLAIRLATDDMPQHRAMHPEERPAGHHGQPDRDPHRHDDGLYHGAVRSRIQAGPERLARHDDPQDEHNRGHLRNGLVFAFRGG